MGLVDGQIGDGQADVGLFSGQVVRWRGRWRGR